MIQQTTAFKVGDKVFASLGQAQQHELGLLIDQICKTEDIPLDKRAFVAMAFIEHGKQVMEILSMQPVKSNPPRKQRSDIGKKRGKKDATSAVI